MSNLVIDPANGIALESGKSVVTYSEQERVPSFCGLCGTPVILACESCATPINVRKRPRAAGVSAFCQNCGNAFPWATREELVGQLYSRLDFEELDNADRLRVTEALAVLSDPEEAGDETKQEKAASTVKRLAPRMWDTGQAIFVQVLGAAVRQQLGLP